MRTIIEAKDNYFEVVAQRFDVGDFKTCCAQCDLFKNPGCGAVALGFDCRDYDTENYHVFLKRLPILSKTIDEVVLEKVSDTLTPFEECLHDICVGWIGEELGWKDYIRTNANVLQKLANPSISLNTPSEARRK